MANALCLKCGSGKRHPWRACRRCGFKPAPHSEDLVRSVYLSIGRFSDPGEAEAYQKELDEVGERIRRGDAVTFRADELARLREERDALARVPMSAVWGAVFRLFAPVIALVALVFLTTRIIRFLKGL
jgi:hypothetical protein